MVWNQSAPAHACSPSATRARPRSARSSRTTPVSPALRPQPPAARARDLRSPTWRASAASRAALRKPQEKGGKIAVAAHT